MTWNDVNAQLLRVLKGWWIVLLISALVVGVATWRLMETNDRYETTTLMVVGPNTEMEPSEILRVADLLGNDIVMSTYSDVMSSPRVVNDAKASVSSSSGAAWGDDYSVRVVQEPDSNVLRMIVEGPDAAASEALSEAVLAQGQAVLSELFPIYSVTPLNAGQPSAELVSLPWARALGLATAIGLGLGALTALWFDSLLQFRRASRRPESAHVTTAELAAVDAQTVAVSRQ